MAAILWAILSPPASTNSDIRAEVDRSKPTKAKVVQILDGLDERGQDAKPPRGDSPTAGSSSKAVLRFPKKRYVPIGRMRIKAIRLSTPFFNGVHDEILKSGPGLWPGTPVPGAPGNSVFSGHRTTYSHPFGDLDLLQKGDPIRVTIKEHEGVTYRVISTAIVPESKYVSYALSQPDGRRTRMITLFACHPKGFRTHRIVVRAIARGAHLGNTSKG